MDESGDNTDEDSSSKLLSQDTSSRSPNDLTSKQSNLSSYSSSSSISSLKSKHMEPTHPTTIRQHSTISSQVRAMTEQSWPQSQKSISFFFSFFRFLLFFKYNLYVTLNIKLLSILHRFNWTTSIICRAIKTSFSRKRKTTWWK